MTSGNPTRRDALKGLAAGGGAVIVAGPGRSEPSAAEVRFLHGVASGDPEMTAVIIWTRVTASGDVVLRWQVAHDPAFLDIAAEGDATAQDANDYTVKIDVRGLAPGRKYFYRFVAGDITSPTGRTRTLPGDDAVTVRLGVVSCSHYSFGFYNVYKELSKDADLDAIVHLGDYIYESGVDGYGGDVGAELGRLHKPPHEIMTLDDYRKRFSQYRLDPDLQDVHAAAPFIAIWDDHETANNSWSGGAQNHKPETHGAWSLRRDAALRAYFEWMPIRDPKPGEAFHRLHRTYQLGKLASLHVIETRLTARSEEVSYDAQMTYFETSYDVSDPEAAKPLSNPEAAALDVDLIEKLKTPFSEADGSPVLDYALARAWALEGLPEGYVYRPDTDRFRREVLADPSREILGPSQLAWLEDGLKASRASGTPWQILGNQVIMARMDAPDYTRAFPPDVIEPAVRDNPYAKRWIDRTAMRLPINPDAWDGYPAARQRVYDAVRAAEANLVVLAGDTHHFWANDLRETPGGRRIGVEFATSSVSSKGGYDYIAADPRVYDIAEETLVREVPEIVYCETRHRGFIILEIDADAVHADYMAVSTVKSREYTTTRLKRFRVQRESEGLISEIQAV